MAQWVNRLRNNIFVNPPPLQGRRKRGGWGGLSLPTFSPPFILYTINIPVTMIHLTMHVHFYNIKYVNPQSIILTIGGVAFFRIDLLNYLTTAL